MVGPIYLFTSGEMQLTQLIPLVVLIGLLDAFVFEGKISKFFLLMLSAFGWGLILGGVAGLFFDRE